MRGMGPIQSTSFGGLLIVWACLTATDVYALTFKEAMERAVANDPQFVAAQANRQASQARVTQAAAENFLQGSISVSTSNNRREYQTRTAPPTQYPLEAYNMSSAQLSFTQPLWRHGNWIAFMQSKIGLEQADYQLQAAGQDMLIRLTQTWFDVMQARDNRIVAESEVRVMQQLFEQALRSHEKGILSTTELEDARAQQAMTSAELAVAESEMAIRQGALEQIIGPASFDPPQLVDNQATPQMGSETLENWLAQAEAGNPLVRAAQRALEASNEEVRKQQAGYEPTLDLVASYGKTSQAAGLTGGQSGFDSYVGSVGLQFNMPLSVGGGQGAKVKEAVAMQDKAIQELEAARRQARMSVKEAWFSWRASKVREAATKLAAQSAEMAVKGAETARLRGIKADIDVLQTRQQLLSAQRDWRRARYDNMLNDLRLQAACGRLTGEELTDIDTSFLYGETKSEVLVVK